MFIANHLSFSQLLIAAVIISVGRNAAEAIFDLSRLLFCLKKSLLKSAFWQRAKT
jgi:hypothetical protein